MPLVIGVDAGGSKIAASDGGKQFLLAESGNARAFGVAVVAARIARIVREVANERPVDAVFVGAAGAADPAVAAALKAALEQALPQTAIGIGDDARIALRAAIPHGDGIVLVAGTGSIAYAEIGGVPYRNGGHGALLGDEGSAIAIGAAAIGLALRAHDGRAQRDALVEGIERHFGREGWFERARGCDLAGIANAAPVVLHAAAAGERSAMQIVARAASELFELVAAVVVMARVEKAELPLVLSGGLLSQKSRLTYLLETRLQSELSNLRIVYENNAASGALTAARALLEER